MKKSFENIKQIILLLNLGRHPSRYQIRLTAGVTESAKTDYGSTPKQLNFIVAGKAIQVKKKNKKKTKKLCSICTVQITLLIHNTRYSNVKHASLNNFYSQIQYKNGKSISKVGLDMRILHIRDVKNGIILDVQVV